MERTTESRPYRLFVMAIASGVNLLSLALFWFVGAALMAKDAFGEVAFALSVSNVVSSIVVAGFGMTVQTVHPRGTDPHVLPVFNAIVLLLLLPVALPVATLAGSMYYVPMVFGQTSFSMTTYDLLARRRYLHFSGWSAGCGVGMAVAGIYGVLTGQPPLTVALMYSLPPVLLGMEFLRSAAHGLRHLSLVPLRAHWQLVCTLGAVTVARTLSSYLDKLVVGAWLGLTTLGEYQFVSQVFMVLLALPATTRNYLIPETASGAATGRAVLLSVLMSVVLAVLSVVAAPVLIPSVFPQYADTVATLCVVSLAVVPATLASTYVARLLAADHTTGVLVSYGGALGGQYACMVLVVPSLGLFGLGLALLAGQVAFFLCAWTADTRSGPQVGAVVRPARADVD